MQNNSQLTTRAIETENQEVESRVIKRAIIATSTACLDQFFDAPDLKVLRMHVHLDDHSYLDDETITHQELVSQMQAGKHVSPKTSPATYDEISDMLLELMERGYEEVLAVVVSSGLSQTYDHLVNLGKVFGSKLTVHVFDSKGLAYPEAVCTLFAYRAMQRGVDFANIIRQLEQMRAGHFAYFVIDDFRNMVHTKRVSAMVGFMAESLGINQIVRLDEKGDAAPHEKVRGTERALKRLCTIMAEETAGKSGLLYFLGFNDPEYLHYAQNFFAQQGRSEVLVYPFSSSSIANLGVMGMGIGFFEYTNAVPIEVYTPEEIVSKLSS